jgi:coatomer subunit beta'
LWQLRVINYNTSEKVTAYEAHPDYIRAIAVHPTLPYLLTASDDMTIKLWDFVCSEKDAQKSGMVLTSATGPWIQMHQGL